MQGTEKAADDGSQPTIINTCSKCRDCNVGRLHSSNTSGHHPTWDTCYLAVPQVIVVLHVCQQNVPQLFDVGAA